MSLSLCQECGEHPATVSVSTTSPSGEKMARELCALCARDLSAGAGWILGQMIDLEQSAEFSAEDDELNEHIAGAPLDALMEACFSDQTGHEDEWEADPFADGETASVPIETVFDSIEVDEVEANAICAGCGWNWNRVQADERVGCARCYLTFRGALQSLFSLVQRETHHIGKAPRAAQKRRRRLEHLRSRRDNQLQVLQNRLDEAVRLERYEDAATLRDKIKIVSSSLF